MDKLSALRAQFPTGADALIITNPINQKYLTDFSLSDSYVVVTARAGYVLTDFRYFEAAQDALDGRFRVSVPKNGYFPAIGEIARADGVSAFAFEDETLSFSRAKQMRDALPNFVFVPAGRAVENLRRQKSADEIEKIKAAQKITDAAFTHILKTITPEMTEFEVALELEYFMRRMGADDKSFDTIAVSGAASSCPHGVPRREKLSKGFLTMDFGCVVDGYHSDMTRTVCLGRANGEMRRLYNTVLFAQRCAIEGAQVGMACCDIDKFARDIIEEAGYHGKFGHSLGHSVGLEIHETPGFAPHSKDILSVGNVITVEPGIYLPGLYGCRIEDIIVARADKIEDITASSSELIELF